MRPALPVTALLLASLGCGDPDPAAKGRGGPDLDDTGAADGSDGGRDGADGGEPTCDGSADRRYDCSGMDPADPAPLGGMVALTFDDGPSDTVTPDVLATLRDFQAPATFFTLGIALEDSRNWDVVEEIVDDPLFTLANHSWDHRNQADLSLSAHQDQVGDTNDLIRSFGVEPDFFRFPYGSSTCQTADHVRDVGMIVSGWHIDTGDWCYAASGETGVCTRDDYWRIPEEYEADMRGFTMEQVRRFDGGVVLFHDIHPYTAAALPDILQQLVDEGYTFVSLDDFEAYPRLNSGDPIDLPFVGEPCEVSNDTCWMVEYEAWCEATGDGDAGVCTVACEGTCLDRDGNATTICAEVGDGGGQCASRSVNLNDCCAAVPGTSAERVDRHVGESGASPQSADACVPEHWL